MRTVLTVVLFTLAVAGNTRSQSGNFSVPALGYVHDKETRSLRPILGIPGAATIGDTIRLPFAITLAAIAPRLNCALARIEDTSKLVLVRNLGSEISWTEIDGIRPEADRIVLSHSGRSAAAYGVTAGVVHVISGLPDHAAVTRTVDLTDAQVRAVAVSDDGRLVAVAFGNETGDVLRVNDGESGTWKDLGLSGRIRSMVFAPNGNDLAVWADGPAAVSIIRDVAATAEWRLVIGEADGLAAPAAVRFVGDSRLLIAASRAVTVVQLGDNSRFELNCACTPTTLEELDGGSTFRLTDLSQGPIWLLHNSDEGSRLLFVPPPMPLATAEVPVQ
jgi:hypothetical protein